MTKLNENLGIKQEFINWAKIKPEILTLEKIHDLNLSKVKLTKAFIEVITDQGFELSYSETIKNSMSFLPDNEIEFLDKTNKYILEKIDDPLRGKTYKIYTEVKEQIFFNHAKDNIELLSKPKILLDKANILEPKIKIKENAFMLIYKIPFEGFEFEEIEDRPIPEAALKYTNKNNKITVFKIYEFC